LLKLNFTKSTAAYLKEKLNLTPAEEEVALYGLQIIIYTLTGFLTICLGGWLLGCFWTTLAVCLTAAGLRLFTGGAHSNSPLTCTLLGMVMVPLLGKIAAITAPLFTLLSLFLIVAPGLILSLIIIWRLAPVDSPAKPITSLEQRKKLRFFSISAVFLLAMGQAFLLIKGQALAIVLALSLGLWWQAFTLTKAGHWFATFTDNFKLRKEGKRNEAPLL
jgi:accessory gene regulator B